MPSIEFIILIIFQGDKTIYEGPGLFDIWTVNKNGKTLVTIRNATTEEHIFEDLPIKVMSTKAPYVTIRAEEV
ncbi:MAG: hypothetical protein HXN04_06525 [Porphyromonadaceae bacterium]|nr:hypothetical protein [Porphyromonadaceae bacterium]